MTENERDGGRKVGEKNERNTIKYRDFQTKIWRLIFAIFCIKQVEISMFC